jgi:nitroimidazol reductase NimA-like FMN-containing flavoprotein (pyridoxamine 5'-phosphate oxidase superfamily)
MLIHELTSAECLEVLGRTHLGRLGCARLNQPYIVPIHFSFDAAGKCVYAFSTVGQKVQWMRDNPKVCLEVEEIVDKHHWTTVLANGLYQEIQSDPAETEARNRAAELFDQRAEWWLPAAANVPWRGRNDIVIYRIQIECLTGRRTSAG